MPGADQERLARILDDYLVAIEQGLPVSPEELLAKHPDDAAQLRGYLSGLELFHAAAGVSPARMQGSLISGGIPQPMQTIGDYQLVREIGRGGMGVVYEACQLSLRRRVALKILPFTAAHDVKHISRFKNEAQAAAQVQHPNIVPVYAIGEENGVHYYVMQLVDGQSLTSLLDGLRSCSKGSHGTTAPNYPDVTLGGPSARTGDLIAGEFRRNSATCVSMRAGETADHIRVVARLAQQAAEALHAAHEYGVVHRDVKPSNLLLDDQGKLWVTDFGLARCREDQAEGRGRLTQTGDVLGTMRYMSPEQAMGRAALIDQRTDVYSLGLTMYELATLHHPADEVSDIQLYFNSNRETPKPLRHWNRYIPHDFQTIVLKCVSEFPHERYSTAKELAEDLECFLEGRPIQASPPSWLSRAGKWAKRRRGVVAAAAAVLFVTVTGAITSMIMVSHVRNAATERELAYSKRLVQDAIDAFNPTDYSDRLAAIPGAGPVRQEMLQAGIEFFEKYAKEAADDPALATEWALTQHKLGTLNEKLGNIEQALKAHAKAMEVWQERVLRDPANLENARNLALAQHHLGLAIWKDGRSAEAITLLTKARNSQQRLLDADSGSRELATDLVLTYGDLGLVLSRTGMADVAIKEFNDAIRLARSLIGQSDANEVVLQSLAANYSNLGLLQDASHSKEAADTYQKAISIQKKLVAADTTNRLYQADLARMCSNLGLLASRAKDWKQAELCYADAIELQQNLVKTAPNSIAYRRDLAISYNNLGMAQNRGGRLTEAESTLLKASNLQDRLLTEQPTDFETRSNQGLVWNNLGTVFDRQRRFANGEKAYQQAILIQRAALNGSPANDLYRARLSEHFVNFARNLNSQKKFDAAMQMSLERKKLWSAQPERLYSVGQQLAITYGFMHAANTLQQSEVECQQAAVETLREAVAAGLPRERLKDKSLASLAGNAEFQKLLIENTAQVDLPGAAHQTTLSRSN